MEKKSSSKYAGDENPRGAPFFSNFESFIQKEFSGIFSKKSKGDGTDWRPGDYELDSKWSWVAMVDRLANGDITKFDQIYERNYIECLNLIGYWKEKDYYVENINKRLQKR